MSKVKRMVVCAANQHRPTGTLILGVRHFDALMRDQIEVRDLGGLHDQWEQGFIDQTGKFMDRTEALTVAEEADQMIRPKYQPKLLFSENIY